MGEIELWDHDSGLESRLHGSGLGFEDELVSKATFHVPYCNMNSKWAKPNKACEDVSPGVPCETHESR